MFQFTQRVCRGDERSRRRTGSGCDAPFHKGFVRTAENRFVVIFVGRRKRLRMPARPPARRSANFVNRRATAAPFPHRKRPAFCGRREPSFSRGVFHISTPAVPPQSGERTRGSRCWFFGGLAETNYFRGRIEAEGKRPLQKKKFARGGAALARHAKAACAPSETTDPSTHFIFETPALPAIFPHQLPIASSSTPSAVIIQRPGRNRIGILAGSEGLQKHRGSKKPCKILRAFFRVREESNREKILRGLPRAGGKISGSFGLADRFSLIEEIGTDFSAAFSTKTFLARMMRKLMGAGAHPYR